MRRAQMTYEGASLRLGSAIYQEAEKILSPLESANSLSQEAKEMAARIADFAEGLLAAAWREEKK